MSKPRSQSPHYRMSPGSHKDRSRKFPWDEPDFNPQKVLAYLDGLPYNREKKLREDPKDRWRFFSEGIDSPGSQESRPLSGRQRHLEEQGRRTPPVFPNELSYGRRRQMSPEWPHHRRDDGGEPDRGREDNRDHLGGIDHGDRSPRERLPYAVALSHSREPSVGWRGEGQDRPQDRPQERPRNYSPGPRFDKHGRGEGRSLGIRDTRGSERSREDPLRGRIPVLKRHRRDMDDPVHLGYGKVEDLRERPSDGFGEVLGDVQGSGLLVVEHGHGIANIWEPPGREFTHGVRDGSQGMDHHTRPRQMGFPSDHHRNSNSRTEAREEGRGTAIQDGRRDVGRESGRGPMWNDRTTPLRFAEQEGPIKYRRGSSDPARQRMDAGRLDTGHGGRVSAVPLRNHPQKFPQENTDFPRGDQWKEYRQSEGDCAPRQEDPVWRKEAKLHTGKGYMTDRNQHLQRRNVADPVAPAQREPSWKSQQETSDLIVVAEESLTIKVDMKRPASRNSALCYSTDRQLSLDLVNVGRQRLDFLPMLEHSGMYKGGMTHTGTFAQEIISLVHQVREQYFGCNTITLNKRFSAPQEGGFREELEDRVVTEGDRPTLNKRFTMTLSTLPVQEPAFDVQLQAVRDPGDLRNSLERRRQERTEGVKITIAGGSLPQRHMGSGSDPTLLLANHGDLEGPQPHPLAWPETQGGRGGGDPRRRGAQRSQNAGPGGRNGRFGNRLGPPRR